VGEHVNLRPFVHAKRVPAQQPAIIQFPEGGVAMAFRYGSVVFFDVPLPRQHTFLTQLVPLVTHAYEQPEIEDITLSIDQQKPDGDIGQAIALKDASVERLQTVAAVLSKSVALAQYEADVAQTFEHIEPFAIQLEQSGLCGHNTRQLLRHIGRTFLNEIKMTARAEVTDRPDLLWERRDLAELYRRLEDEFELRERAAILDRKLDLVSRTVNTVIDLLQKSRSMRVEWYIVVLFVTELALSAYQLFWKIS
jgi:uncharacterized Rmd1/YagE family protein